MSARRRGAAAVREGVLGAPAELPALQVAMSDLPATAAELGKLLAASGRLYYRGHPVMLSSDGGSDSGLKVVSLTAHAIVNEAHAVCRPMRWDTKAEKLVAMTLPERVANLYLARPDNGLPVLSGIATTPLLSDSGVIRLVDGHDPQSGFYCAGVPSLAVATRPPETAARAALAVLRDAFRTFPFAGAARVADGVLSVIDTTQPPGEAETAFLVALLTACCRPSLPLAPGVLVTAPEVSGAGSGKGLLVRAIMAVAYGVRPPAFTAGRDPAELDKRLVAEIIEAGPCIFLDNANSTALRSDTLASVMTERPARVRVMGSSRSMPVNSGAMVAVTGNGLSVSDDLARRFLTVTLDPEVEDPETRPFKPGFLDSIMADRARLLSAALTIWRWGRQNADTIAKGLPLGSYETWACWVRDPLMALGCADPVARMVALKDQDPRRIRVAEIFTAWHRCHGTAGVKAASLDPDVVELLDPHKRGRQHQAATLSRMVGTRAAGFVLAREEPAGRWGVATYRLAPDGASTAPQGRML